MLLLDCQTRAKDDLSPLETHYFDYLTKYESYGLSFRGYYKEKGISYGKMSVWLEAMKRNVAKKDQEISPKEREQKNNIIDRLIREVRTKDAIGIESNQFLMKQYSYRMGSKSDTTHNYLMIRR